MKTFVPDRFSIIRVLREESDSKTFLATDHVLERSDVIVKILRKGYFNRNRNRLIEQLSWFSGVRHSNLSIIFDAGVTSKGDLYYVREYLPASELFSIDSLSVTKALVSAVGFLRSHARIHGAIKPSNLFLNNGLLKLADPKFGSGLQSCEEDIRFSAPEVLRGEGLTLESDLYSVGAVLYRILTQRNLFEDTDLSHLRAKHVWASPLSIGNLSDVPKLVSDLVMKLLDKDPAKRTPAFASLREHIRTEPPPATRAPFIGREALLKETIQFVSERSRKGLRVLFVEGVPGIGKSRFIEELRINCAFEGLLFRTFSCLADSGKFHPVLQTICRFLASIDSAHLSPDLGALSTVSDATSDTESKKNYLAEKLANDTVALLRTLARQIRLVLAIENIDRADPATIRFIEYLSFRAAEIPLSLVLSVRNVQPDSKVNSIFNIVKSELSDDFRHIPLGALIPTEFQALAHYLGASSERHAELLKMSGGNPLFVEGYVSSDTREETGAQRIREASEWMASQITRGMKPLADALSLLRRPVEIETIAKICGQNMVDLQRQLGALENIGVIRRSGDVISIASSYLATLIYKRIVPSSRVSLAKGAFELLRESTTQGDEDLAYYAFEARMFNEASKLYQQLANAAFEQQNYQYALRQYERLKECEQRGGSRFPAADKLKLSICYQWVGKQRYARRVCEPLLAEETVRNDPELLSDTYARLSHLYDRTSTTERLRLSRLAIDCLTHDSPKLGRRYAELSSHFLEVGNLSAATDAFEKAKQNVRSEKDAALLDMVRGALFINMGDFRRAAEFFLRADCKYSNCSVQFINTALSFGNLGDLKRALEFQSKARALAIENGVLPLQIMALNNLGLTKTKFGQMREGEQLFTDALSLLEELRRKESDLDVDRFVAAYCDAALHSFYVGKYRRAAEYLKSVRPAAGAVYELDRVYCRVIQCLFYLAIGFVKKVRTLLAQLDGSQTFKTPFFQVERRLLEARMPCISTNDKLGFLEEALQTTQELGTLYQQCQVQNELAAVLISAGEKQKAQEFAKSALRLARRQGYKLLAARAMLLAGITSERATERQHRLLAAFQSSSEMGLLELVAESAFHIGMLHLESENLITAREYLVRSVSTTDQLAEEIPVRFRANYLALPWRRDARKALERCNATLQQASYMTPNAGESIGEDRYFKATYRFALSAAATKSADALVTQIEETLRTSSARGTVVTLKGSTGLITRGVRLKPTDEVIQRVHSVAAMAKNRTYFGSAEMGRQKETVAWIPLQSETREGGIFVVCRQNEPPLTEKEMELLAIIGTVANGALRGLETNQVNELERMDVAEFHGMIGASKPMREVYSHIQIAARNTATVLIEGESGTGKELVAKAIHAAGPRVKEPFIAVDCGAIPESLIEAELFGAKKGSYTGAVADRPGLFEAANRGTIFLDEISNTTPALQAKLLRVIQEREVRRIGETKDHPIDVRLIVASNRNLEALVNEGRFRKDLLYRLKVLYIKVPPLRSRQEDIPMLAHAFLQKLNATNKLRKYFAPGVLNHLAAQMFPGNVRELQNAIERAFFSARGSVISEVPLEGLAETAASHDEVQSWFKDLSEGRKDFWSAVHNRYKRRDISREKVVALVDIGLRASRGSYRNLASRFRLKGSEYRRFMDFLRRNECLLDFRPYRKAAAETD